MRMLILKRRTGQSLIMDGNIKITVIESGNEGVKLAIDAPKDVVILREELVEAVEANQEAAAGDKKLEKLKDILG